MFARSIAVLLALIAPLALAGSAQGTPVLYVSLASSPDRVVAVDPATYVAQGTAFQDPALVSPDGLALGPNGHVYVVSAGTRSILEFDPATGQLVGTVVTDLPTLTSNILRGTELAFGPNGDLYVGLRTGGASASDELRRYDPTTGTLLDTLAGVGPAFAFGPDGLIYGTASDGLQISRYDPTSFSLVDVFATSPITSMTFVGGSTYLGGGITHLAFTSDGNLVTLNQATFQDSFGQQESAAGIFMHDAGGNLVGPSTLVPNFIGHFDLAVDPANGKILSTTDAEAFVEWQLSGPVAFLGSVPYIPIEVLFVPEPASLTSLALLAGLLWLRRHAV